MATTKIKPIRKTIARAIEYIVDPEKTADGSLVSSYGCGVGTADIQMQMTAKQGSGRGNRIAYHLIQSFSPDDNVTPEQAHQIGMEFAQKVLKGKYEFVIATHVDKGHIHNHIIFNATNYYDYKKYHYDVWERDRIRSISDNLCRKNGLSVIEQQSGVRGRGMYEYRKSKEGKSLMDNVRAIIDRAIEKAESFDEFKKIIEEESNHTLKRRGKFLRLIVDGKVRRLKDKTLGDAYTEEAIRDRIEHPENAEKYKTVINKEKDSGNKSENQKGKAKNRSQRQDTEKTYKKPAYTPNPNRINLIVDISKNLKAQQSQGYEQALVRSNLNTLVKTMNFLINNNLKTGEDFGKYYNGILAEYKLIHNDIENYDNKLYKLSEKIKFLQNYKKYHNLCMAAKRAGTNSAFYKEHENEILLFETARLYFESINENPDTLNLADLFEKFKEVKQDKTAIEKVFKDLKKQLKELDTIRQNVETTLGIELLKEEEQAEPEKDKSKKKDNIQY